MLRSARPPAPPVTELLTAQLQPPDLTAFPQRSDLSPASSLLPPPASVLPTVDERQATHTTLVVVLVMLHGSMLLALAGAWYLKPRCRPAWLVASMAMLRAPKGNWVEMQRTTDK
eukprot:1150539-Prymnesium_polylepis.1